MVIERSLRLALAGLILGAFASAEPKPQFLYVGNYDNGIQAFRYDSQTLALQPLGMVGEIQRPSFLTLHPNGRFLYAVSELGNDGVSQGYVYAFSLDKSTGKLHVSSIASNRAEAAHVISSSTRVASFYSSRTMEAAASLISP